MSSTMLPSYASTFSPVGGALRQLQLSGLAPAYRSPYHREADAKWASVAMTMTPSVSPSTGARTSQLKPQSQSPAVKKTRKSRVVFDFSTEEMAKYFHMSQREAAAQLGVATVTIKRNCRRLGIVWPYRLLKAKKLPQASTSGSGSCSSSPSSSSDSPAGRWRAISREQARQIREERARARAQAKRNLSVVSAATAMTMLGRSDPTSTSDAACSPPTASMTAAGRAFARLPLECMAQNE